MARLCKCPVCGRRNPLELTRCQWCKAEIGSSPADASIVGTYLDGRPVCLSTETGGLDVGGTPVDIGAMLAYDAAAQIRWTSDDARRRALHAYDDSPLTMLEWILYGTAFVAVLGFSGVAGTALYLAWNKSQPVKARQLLRLGWAVFALGVVVIGILDFVHVLPGT